MKPPKNITSAAFSPYSVRSRVELNGSNYIERISDTKEINLTLGNTRIRMLPSYS